VDSGRRQQLLISGRSRTLISKRCDGIVTRTRAIVASLLRRHRM
jgi:hypothetical protein